MSYQFKISRRSAFAVTALIVTLAAIALWVFNPNRKMPLSQALSAKYWVSVLNNTYQYDPVTGLLQHGNPNLKEVAITIDDGPDPRYERQIVEILRSKGAKATFFVVGIRAKQYPELIRLLVTSGQEVANHTYDHQRLNALPPHQIADELRLGTSHIVGAGGPPSRLFRPPGDQYNDKVLSVAKGLGCVTVSYTVGARDYEPQPVGFIAKRVINRTENGSIILLHQDNQSTVDDLPSILDRLRQDGYSFVTVSQMLSHLDPPR